MNSVEHDFSVRASYGDGSSYTSDIQVDVTVDVGAPDNETAGRLADEIDGTVKKIIREEVNEDESEEDSYEPSTPQEAFRALVWGAVMSGEKDFLTKREMSESLVEIADTVYPIHKWDDESELQSVSGSYMERADE